jgi:PAS domain S-box-containing protein
MQHRLHRVIQGGERTAEQIEFEKHLSLIHILKGQEEFLLNDQGIIISSNLEAVNITGYEEFEIIGRHISIFYLAAEEEKARVDLEKAANLGQIFVTGLRVKKRGTTFWAKMQISKVQGDANTIHFKVIVQDATHRALSNLRVQTIKDEYLTIFNNPFVGIFKFRMEDCSVLKCNQKLMDITGCTADEKLSFKTFFNSTEQFEQFITLLKKEKRVEGFKFLIHDDHIVHQNWAVVSARYFEHAGFVEGVVVDISEQHTQMMELQRVNTELDKFTYHASHDLRAPLATMLGLVHLGKQETSLETIQSYMEMLRGQISHLDILLKDLISVSYNNTRETEYQVFNFASEINSLVKALLSPGNDLQLELDIQQHAAFYTDPVRMRTILRNLLMNAFQYFNPESERSFVKLNIQVHPTLAVIQLQDNGIGIEVDHKDKVYEMFFRGTTRSNGTGLGLYIVKAMVDKLKGQIALESTVNRGSTFLLTLPNHENISPPMVAKL